VIATFTKQARQLTPVLVAAVGVCMTFVLTTVVMDQVPDTLLLAVPLLIAAGGAAVLLGAREALSKMRSTPRPVIMAAVGGVAAFWAAPLIVLSQRASDAPSGAVVLFQATALWGVLAACTWALAAAEKTTYLAAIGAFASAVGSAAILANWERPSSFSPFVKFPVQEVLIVAAGAVFVVGSLALVRAARVLGSRSAAFIAIVASAGVAGIVALPTLGDSLGQLSRLSAEFALLGIGVFAFAWGWVAATEQRGVALSAPALLVAPVLLTLLSVLERATGVYGPNPILWRGALPGMALCVAGAALTSTSSERVAPLQMAARYPLALTATRWVSGLALAIALVALGLPVLRANSVGVIPVPFEVTWAMLGYEAAAGWLPVAAALVVFAASSLASSKTSRTALVLAAITALTAVVAYPFLLDTPLHTWNNWIPSDVQQTYGTEYARFSVQVIASPAGMAAVIASALSAIGLLACAFLIAPTEDLT